MDLDHSSSMTSADDSHASSSIHPSKPLGFPYSLGPSVPLAINREVQKNAGVLVFGGKSAPNGAATSYHLPQTVKIMLIGDSQVGKTAMMRQFCDAQFDTNSMVTIGEDANSINPMHYKHDITVTDNRGNGVKLISRRAGGGEYVEGNGGIMIRDGRIPGLEGIDFKIKTIELRGKKIKLQIWDTAGQERFHTITTSYYRGAMGIMLVYDITNAKSFDNIAKWLRNIDEHASEDVEKMLLGNKCDMSDRRVVSRERGEAIARDHGIRFLETSAKANIHIDKAFYDLAEAILEKMPNRNLPDVNPPGVRPGVQQQTARPGGGCC